jgi:SAM-dependent methyltransferase
MPDDAPLALAAYEALADAYDDLVGEKPANAHLERPATRGLLPDLDGECVLDAGCGPGVTTRELREGGACPVGVDVSPRMLELARERNPRVGFVRADLGSALPFADGAFDGVHSSLALHYVRDWSALFAELARVSRPGGWLVCSTQHPFADFDRLGGDYFAVTRVSEVWDSFGEAVDVPFYRRPLEAVLNPLLDAGYRLDRVVEAEPTDRFREERPGTYERVAEEPTFLSLRARLVD